jgi:hypothetical protein
MTGSVTKDQAARDNFATTNVSVSIPQHSPKGRVNSSTGIPWKQRIHPVSIACALKAGRGKSMDDRYGRFAESTTLVTGAANTFRGCQ